MEYGNFTIRFSNGTGLPAMRSITMDRENGVTLPSLVSQLGLAPGDTSSAIVIVRPNGSTVTVTAQNANDDTIVIGLGASVSVTRQAPKGA